MPELKSPIIVLGNFRSGTTLLQRVIASHPDIVELYEPVGLWLYADPARPHDEFTAAEASPSVKDYIRSQFLNFQEENSGKRIVEKTPHNILRIDFVRTIFPDAKFIYLVRNPFSFISSVELKWQKPAGGKRIWMRLTTTPITQIHHYVGKFFSQQFNKRVLGKKYLSIWGPRYDGISHDVAKEDLLTVIARQWARPVDKAEKELPNFTETQLLRLRYEDFVAEPLKQLERICAHCDIDMHEEMIAFVRETVRTDRQLKWQRFDTEELARLLPEIRHQMSFYDYEIPEDFR